MVDIEQAIKNVVNAVLEERAVIKQADLRDQLRVLVREEIEAIFSSLGKPRTSPTNAEEIPAVSSTFLAAEAARVSSPAYVEAEQRYAALNADKAERRRQAAADYARNLRAKKKATATAPTTEVQLMAERESRLAQQETIQEDATESVPEMEQIDLPKQYAKSSDDWEEETLAQEAEIASKPVVTSSIAAQPSTHTAPQIHFVSTDLDLDV